MYKSLINVLFKYPSPPFFVEIIQDSNNLVVLKTKIVATEYFVLNLSIYLHLLGMKDYNNALPFQ
jgi:hypothetical protein